MRVSPHLHLALLTCALWTLAPGLAPCSEEPAAPAPNAVAPTKLEVGGVTVMIPVPAGFERADGINPKWDAAVQSTVAASNRMLAFYIPTKDVATLRAGNFPELERSFNVQILKSLETKEIGEKTFLEARGEIRKGVENAKAQVDAKLKELAEKGNATVHDQFGVDAALKISNTAVLGYFDDSPNSLGFTMAMKYQVQGAANVDGKSVVAAMVTPFNGRLFYLYANADYKSEADRQWAEKSVSAWRDAILAANPRVQGPSAKSLSSNTVSSELIGQIVGAAIGVGLVVVILVLVSARKKTS